MRLRALEIADLPYLYRWENDARAWGDGDTHNPLSQHVLREYIRSSTGDIFRDGQVRLVIDREGETLGCIDLFDVDARSRRAAIGMYVSPEARGQGVGQAALRLLEEYAFGFLRLHMLYAVIAEDNAPCRAIYGKSGYTPSTRLSDWIVREDGSYAGATVYQKTAIQS